VLSVFTREWLDADVAVVDGFVAGSARTRARDGRRVGRYVVPGFVDAHVHLESSKLLVGRVRAPRRPARDDAVVADPHEIANVLGTDGVHWLPTSARGLPLDVCFMASSCVPASRFESPRRRSPPATSRAAAPARARLAEMMNFPA
jgi:adenine deaminase